MSDTVNRQDVIDVLLFSKEFVMKVLDNMAVVGNTRDKYSWGLELVNSLVHDIEELPSVEPEIIRCKECRHGVDYYHEGDCYCSNPKWGLMYFGGSWDFYCADAERRTDEVD